VVEKEVVKEVPKVQVVETEKLVEVEKIVEREKEVMVVATPTAAPRPAVEKQSRTLVVSQLSNPLQLSCWFITGVDELDVLNHISEPLIRFNREGALDNIVAEAWEFESPTSYLFNIRKGVKFHDPKYGEVTAEDVAASMKACYKPSGQTKGRVPPPLVNHEVEIIDQHTIRIKMPDPGTAELPNVMSAFGFVTSKKYLEEVGSWPHTEQDGFGKAPMGAGAFTFEEWVQNERIVMDKFPDYWGPDPGVDRIEWRIIPDAFTRKSEFLTGGVDILPFLLPEWQPEIAANPDVHVESVLSSRFVFVVLPIREPPYNDKRVRQALNYAVNKVEIAEQLFRGTGAIPLTGVTHPFLPEVDPDRVGYPYNPEKAKELLDEARADGVNVGKITFMAPNDRYTLDKETGEAVAGYWREIGLDVEYIPQSRSVLFPPGIGLELTDPWLIGNGNILLRASTPYFYWLEKRPEPRSRGDYYADGPDEWDELIVKLSATISGGEESTNLARQLDELYTEYAPWVFLVNYVDLYGVRNNIVWKPYPHEYRLFLDVEFRD
jgi:peptide/nickel transport system substrate-binding protein